MCSDQIQREAGFSLIQILVVVALLAVVATGGILAASSYRTAVNRAKLKSDVATLNRATRTFLANGGALSGLSTVDAVLARLKTGATASQKDQVVGLRESMIDGRLTPVAMTTEEEAGTELRVTWNGSSQRFELKTSGPGVKEFALGESFTGGEHNRNSSIEYASQDNWIWDYTDRQASRPPAPDDAPLMNPAVTPPAASAPAGAIQLAPPSLAPAGGSYALTDYPLMVTLTPDPGNPPDSVEFYSTDGGASWVLYETPITVDPDTRVRAYAATSDPDRYVDSTIHFEDYASAAVEIELALSASDTNLSYTDLGGPLLPGTTPPPAAASPPMVTLVNGAQIPVDYQNSDTFEIRYTFDGSEPLTSGTASSGDPFTGGFPGQIIPISFSHYSAASSFGLQAAALAKDLSVVSDSQLKSLTFTTEILDLTPPLIDRDIDTGEVSIELPVDDGNVPVGARIYYSVDGTDPGVGLDGNPLGGTEYTAPFTPEEDVDLVARVYPPTAYIGWFNASSPTTVTFVVPKYDVYIGGDFYLDDGSSKTHRNVARLTHDGQIDPAFSPGQGANAGSIVGVVIRQSGNGVLVGGDFQTMAGSVVSAFVRLNEAGGIDSAFDAALE